MTTLHFPPDLAAEIKQYLLSGRYASEVDVVRDAMQALKRHDKEVAAIQAGIDDVEAGRVIPLREFDREFRERHNIPADS